MAGLEQRVEQLEQRAEKLAQRVAQLENLCAERRPGEPSLLEHAGYDPLPLKQEGAGR